jgi:hypothetical protein
MNWNTFSRGVIGLFKDSGFRWFFGIMVTILLVSGFGFHALTLYLIGEAQKESARAIVRSVDALTAESRTFRQMVFKKEIARGAE